GRCPPTAGPSPVPRGRPGGLLCSRCRCACGEERCSSWRRLRLFLWRRGRGGEWAGDLGRQSPQECEPGERSEEHTSELQSRFDIVCRLLLEKIKFMTLLS